MGWQRAGWAQPRAAGASARGTSPGDGTGLAGAAAGQSFAGAGLGGGQVGDVLAQQWRQEHSQPSVCGLYSEGEGRKRISGKKKKRMAGRETL